MNIFAKTNKNKDDRPGTSKSFCNQENDESTTSLDSEDKIHYANESSPEDKINNYIESLTKHLINNNTVDFFKHNGEYNKNIEGIDNINDIRLYTLMYVLNTKLCNDLVGVDKKSGLDNRDKFGLFFGQKNDTQNFVSNIIKKDKVMYNFIKDYLNIDNFYTYDDFIKKTEEFQVNIREYRGAKKTNCTLYKQIKAGQDLITKYVTENNQKVTFNAAILEDKTKLGQIINKIDDFVKKNSTLEEDDKLESILYYIVIKYYNKIKSIKGKKNITQCKIFNTIINDQDKTEINSIARFIINKKIALTNTINTEELTNKLTEVCQKVKSGLGSGNYNRLRNKTGITPPCKKNYDFCCSKYNLFEKSKKNNPNSCKNSTSLNTQQNLATVPNPDNNQLGNFLDPYRKYTKGTDTQPPLLPNQNKRLLSNNYEDKNQPWAKKPKRQSPDTEYIVLSGDDDKDEAKVITTDNVNDSIHRSYYRPPTESVSPPVSPHKTNNDEPLTHFSFFYRDKNDKTKNSGDPAPAASRFNVNY